MTQQEALLILKTGANVFLTGEPGSGKTHTINQYVSYLRSCGVEPAITASTGIAATHIGGHTIHSWCGIGIRRALSKYDLDHIGQNRSVVRRVGSARVLIIDEISMLSSGTLSMVDAVCREIKRSVEPFGGLQIVLVGDFFQLPPVSEADNESNQASFIARDAEEFAFHSTAWAALNPIVCYLSEQHRQEDAIFLEFLSAIRKSEIEERHKDILRSCYSLKPKENTPHLYSRNVDVDKINNIELGKLASSGRIFKMRSRGLDNLIKSLKRGCLSPEVLELKIGARVMFTKNDTLLRRYVNGTLGTVVGFSDDGSPAIKTRAGKNILAEPEEWRLEEGGRVLARIIQIPLRLAWAFTVHKSQGMSLDSAHMDLSRAFAYGQGYVAISRVRTLSGLSLAGLNDRALEVHPEIRAKDSEFAEYSDLARQKFIAIDAQGIAKLHNNFIRACGGSVVKSGSPPTFAEIGSTYDITKTLLQGGKTFAEIAESRGLALSTIVGHVEKLAAGKKIDPAKDLAHIKPPERFAEIKKALLASREKDGKMLLTLARAILGESCSYNDLRLARLFLL